MLDDAILPDDAFLDDAALPGDGAFLSDGDAGDAFRPGAGLPGVEVRYCGVDPVRPGLGEDLRVGVRGEADEPGPAPEPESSRRAVRARDSRERLEKDMTPRYYVPRFQRGRSNVGDC
ncbi:hypothetical protein GCM10017708_00710 [Arthrobacter citreus]